MREKSRHKNGLYICYIKREYQHPVIVREKVDTDKDGSINDIPKAHILSVYNKREAPVRAREIRRHRQ